MYGNSTEHVHTPAFLKPASPSSGRVEPMKTAQGNDYPATLRTQQVGFGVVKAVVNRINESLAGGPIRLSKSVLGDAEKAVLRRHLFEVLFPELFGDPLPVEVQARQKITSIKARKLIGDRLEKMYTLEDGLQIPGLTIDQADLLQVMTLVEQHVLAVDEEVI